MQPNVGIIDRLFRLVLGIGLIGAALAENSVFGTAVLRYGAVAVGALFPCGGVAVDASLLYSAHFMVGARETRAPVRKRTRGLLCTPTHTHKKKRNGGSGPP